MDNQLNSVTEKPVCFLRLQGLACDWSKHNGHSRNIFSVHGFVRLSVKGLRQTDSTFPCNTDIHMRILLTVFHIYLLCY